MMDPSEWQRYRQMVEVCRLTYRLREAARIWAETHDEAIKKLHRLLSLRIDDRLKELVDAGIMQPGLFDDPG